MKEATLQRTLPLQPLTVPLDALAEDGDGLFGLGRILRLLRARSVRLEVLEAVFVNLLVDEVLDSGQFLPFVLSDEGDGDSVHPHAAGSADPVDVVLRVQREVE